MSRSIKLILLPLIILWVIVVITGYYWGHQYTLIPPVIGILRSIVQVVIALLFFLTAGGLGWLSLTALRINFVNRVEAAIFSAGMGLCLMSLLTLALGYLGMLNQTVFWPLSLLGTSLAIFFLVREVRRSPSSFKLDTSQLLGLDYFFLAFIGITLLLGLQLALAPPVAWDGLTTHLVFVDDILEAGRLNPVPVSPGRYVGHMLFIWAMSIGGDSLPQLISYGIGLLLIAAAAQFTRNQFGLRPAVLASAILVSVEVFLLNAGWPYLDVPVAFFSWLAVISLFYWQTNKSSRRIWLILAAILAVFASHTKLNGLFLYPALGGSFLLGLYWNRQQWKTRLIDGAFAFGTGLILILIWSAVEASLSAEFDGPLSLVPPQASSVASNLPTVSNLFGKASSYVNTLWEMTILGQQGSVVYDGAIGPFFLLLIPILIILRKKPRVVISLLLVALIELAAWLLFPREYYQNRHLIIAYPIFSVLSAYVIFRLDEFDFEWFTLSGFFRLLLVLIFSLQLLSTLVWWQGLNPLSYLLGLSSRDDYLGSALNGGSSPGYYDMMLAMEETLPDSSVVGLTWPEPRLYYCSGDCVRFPFQRIRSAEEMLTEARELGLTHILVSRDGIDYWLEFYEDRSALRSDRLLFQRELDKFTEGNARLIHTQDDSFFLYELSFNADETRSISEMN